MFVLFNNGKLLVDEPLNALAPVPKMYRLENPVEDPLSEIVISPDVAVERKDILSTKSV